MCVNNKHQNENFPQHFLGRKRRGPFKEGERVQITDYKGQHYTIILQENAFFQSRRGSFHHRELIGKAEGTVLQTESGHQILCLRPLITDYALSMPRGATVIYPKDAGQIIHMADVFPGARVLEAGAGSGAITVSLLAAVGEKGKVYSVERRAEFADIARGNVESWYGINLPNWELTVSDLSQYLVNMSDKFVDRVVLDMLAPWEHVEQSARVIEPGGVFLAYVTTVTQLSRIVEALRDSGYFTEPTASETMVRSWHVKGIAVRPDHRMVAHTGFLVLARRLAKDGHPLELHSRPAPAAYSEILSWQNSDGSEEQWTEEDLLQRSISEKKLRKVRRDVLSRYEIEGEDPPEPFSE